MKFSTIIALLATAAATAQDQTTVSKSKQVSSLSEDDKAEID